VNTEIGVWLAMAVLALIWANLALWRTRHALSRSRQCALMQGLPPSSSTLVPALLTPPLREPDLEHTAVIHPTSPVLTS
jgi:hypothetical protein